MKDSRTSTSVKSINFSYRPADKTSLAPEELSNFDRCLCVYITDGTMFKRISHVTSLANFVGGSSKAILINRHDEAISVTISYADCAYNTAYDVIVNGMNHRCGNFHPYFRSDFCDMIHVIEELEGIPHKQSLLGRLFSKKYFTCYAQ